MPRIHLSELSALVEARLQQAGANPIMAASTAKALVLAEAQGLGSHGLSRLSQYAVHLQNGRANGAAIPFVAKQKGGAVLIDAQNGLAFPACDLAIQTGIAVAKTNGIAFVGVVRSHHCGVVVDHLRAVAEAGMVGIGFANSPAAMPAAGGRHAIFGTNPIAAIFPRRAHAPLMIDLSLSQVARGKIMVAAKEGRAIPEGWALDKNGQPTTDAKAALDGSMLPFGGGSGNGSSTAGSSPKGAMLALIVELLVTAVIGAHFGYEASSFFVDEGNQPELGQAFIVIDPSFLAGQDQFLNRVEVLVAEMLLDVGVRLPGARREALRLIAQAEGIDVPDAFLAR